MADFDFKEYTRMRDIAQKRVKRLGLPVHIPTVKELRNDTGETVVKAFQNLRTFLEKGPSKSRWREAAKVAKEHEREEFPKTYQSYVKGIKRLGVYIEPSKLPAFFDYVDYRFAQGKVSKKYLFDIFLDDYQKMLEKGYNPSQIIDDFEQFAADQAALAGRAADMEGMSAKQALELWTKFIG